MFIDNDQRNFCFENPSFSNFMISGGVLPEKYCEFQLKFGTQYNVQFVCTYAYYHITYVPTSSVKLIPIHSHMRSRFHQIEIWFRFRSVTDKSRHLNLSCGDCLATFANMHSALEYQKHMANNVFTVKIQYINMR